MTLTRKQLALQEQSIMRRRIQPLLQVEGLTEMFQQKEVDVAKDGVGMDEVLEGGEFFLL